MEKIIIIYCTINSEPSAREIANKAVQENMAACVNIIPNITSIYKWENKLESNSEYILIFKTAYNNKAKLMNWLEENHPYDVPAILCFNSETTTNFLQFIEDNSKCLIN